MKLVTYLKDKFNYIIMFLVSVILIINILFIFKVNTLIIILISSILCMNLVVFILSDFIKRKIFYDKFKSSLNSIDQKYLITELINYSNFIDSKLFLEYLYEIDKSMIENINKYRLSSKDFIEYLEMWCHEIKTPLATLYLMIENNKNEFTLSVKEEIDKINDYVEQVLYYSRSDNVEKDYIIKKVNLKDVIDKTVLRNKKYLISRNIKIDIKALSTVYTDSKWLEFILNQIVGNCIKYSKNNNSYIKFYTKEQKNNTILYIEDNGIGIPSNEVDRVFDKCFTGSNGRINKKSTGIGLYLCKKLCLKLGHKIELVSDINNGTIVRIVFPKSNMINEVH